MEAPTITLGAVTATLLPCSPFTALALIPAEGEGAEVGIAKACATIGLCWPTTGGWPAKTRPKPWVPGASLIIYGASVFDALSHAGHATSAILEAATKAYTWAVSALPSEQEVTAAEGFSGAPTGG